MPKNKISDLRNHLFETLEALKDKESPMDLDRAQTICQVAQTIINSAKVEVALVQAIEGTAPTTPFFDIPEAGSDGHVRRLEEAPGRERRLPALPPARARAASSP